MKLKVLALGALLLSVPSAAFAQGGCTGQPASGFVCGNSAATQGLPGFFSQSVLLDRGFGTTQGMMLNRGASTWSATATPSLGLNGGTGGSLTLNGSSTGSAAISVAAAAGSTTFQLPVGNGTNNFFLRTDGSGHTSWVAAPGSGTVTSVALALPGIFTVSGSPVTSAGTLTGTLANQNANLVWAGPTTGAAAAPTFRSLVGADLPNPSSSSLGGIQSAAGVSHQWINAISTSGVPALSQPAFTDISGTVAAAQLPNPTASTLGGVESFVAVAHQWINTISTSGVPSATQPAFSDLSGSATLAQLPSISNNSVLGNNAGGTAVPSTLSASNVLDMLGSTQGQVLYRNASAWVPLNPGTNGQVLTSAGAAANPTWTTVAGTGTVTSVASGTGLTGGPITVSGTLSLASITAGSVLANVTGGSAVPIANTPSSVLDLIGSGTGSVLYRAAGGTGWQALAAGTNGQVLTMGASTPAWGSAGTVSSVATGQGLSGGTITTSGTLVTAAGVDTNTLNAKTANYTILNTDCGKTIQAGAGTTGLFTITLPSVSGFDTKCVVTIVNGDTGRGKILSGFPATMTSPSLLWPSQQVTVKIVNGAWIASNPGRWAKQNITFFVNSGASASDTSDGLADGALGAGSFATLAHCVSVAELYVDTQSGGNGGVTCSPKTGQSFQEFVQVFFNLVGGGSLIFSGNGGQFTWKPVNSGYALQVGDLGVVGLSNVLFDTTGVTTPTGYVLGHNYGVVDVDTGVTMNTGGLSASLMSCDYDTHFNINNGITIAGVNGAASGFLYQACQGSSWNIGGTHTFSATPNIARFAFSTMGAKMIFQGNVTFSGANTMSASLINMNGAIMNLSGATLPGGAPTQTTGGQYCTTTTC